MSRVDRLIRVVDTVGLKLVVSGDREILSATSLVLAIRTVEGTNFPTTSVDIFNTDNVQVANVKDFLPEQTQDKKRNSTKKLKSYDP